MVRLCPNGAAASSSIFLLALVQLSSFSLAFSPISTTTSIPASRHAPSTTTQLHASNAAGVAGGGGLALNPAQTAVIMCKFQNDFAAEGGKIYETVKEVMDATNMLENSKKFVALSRKLGCQIVHCPLSTQPVCALA
jgi:Isochorismatase family